MYPPRTYCIPLAIILEVPRRKICRVLVLYKVVRQQKPSRRGRTRESADERVLATHVHPYRPGLVTLRGIISRARVRGGGEVIEGLCIRCDFHPGRGAGVRLGANPCGICTVSDP